MNLFSSIFKSHFSLVKNNPLAAIILFAASLVVIISSYYKHTLLMGCAYLFAVWISCFITDVIVTARPNPALPLLVKHPKKELLLICISCLLGLAFLCIRFFTDWNHLPSLSRLAVLPLMLFTFPIALAALFFFKFKYKPKELGLNFNYWYISIIIHIIFGILSYFFARKNIHWVEEYKQDGLVQMLVLGFLYASIPEEFTRMLLQTRFSKVLNNAGLGIVIGSIIWSLMHFPIFGEGLKRDEMMPALLSSLRLIPLGFLWGYLIHRTKSISSSVILHGFNLWGIQYY